MENYNQSHPENSYTDNSIFKQVIEFNGGNRINLAEAAKWARFLGIISAILIVVFFAAGIFFLLTPAVNLNSLADFQNLNEFGLNSPLFIMLVYFLPGIITIYPTWTFLRFGSLTRKGIRNENQAQFDKGLDYLKKCLKFSGVLVIILISFYIIGIFAMAIGIQMAGGSL